MTDSHEQPEDERSAWEQADADHQMAALGRDLALKDLVAQHRARRDAGEISPQEYVDACMEAARTVSGIDADDFTVIATPPAASARERLSTFLRSAAAAASVRESEWPELIASASPREREFVDQALSRLRADASDLPDGLPAEWINAPVEAHLATLRQLTADLGLRLAALDVRLDKEDDRLNEYELDAARKELRDAARLAARQHAATIRVAGWGEW